MINSTFKVILKTKFVFCLFLTLTIISCGSFNSNGYTSEDGIYGNKPAKETNQNGLYYKNYFDQKAEEYGLNESNNDSIVTDINSYSSQTTGTKLAYSGSKGAWGDNPTSINFIYRDNPLNSSYWSPFYNPYYSSFYSPFNSFGYGMYGGFGYWDYMFRPWGYRGYYGYGSYYGGYGGYGGYYGGHYGGYGGYNSYQFQNERYGNSNIAYMNGRRGTNLESSSSLSGNVNSSGSSLMLGKSISNYNVGRNDTESNNTPDSSNSDNETNNTRNINRLYYSLKSSSLNNSSSIRNYQNEGEIRNGGGASGTNQNSRTRPSYTRPSNGNKSNFQLSNYRNSSGVNNVSRTSSGSTNNSSSSNSSGRSYDVSRSNPSSSSSSSRSSYSPPSSSSSSSSGGRPSSPASSSGGSSRGPR